MPVPSNTENRGLGRLLTAPSAMVAALILALLAVTFASGQTSSGPSSSPVSPSADGASASASQGQASAPSALPSGTSSSNGTSSTDPSALSFGPIHFAGHANYVYRDNVTAAQILLTDTTSTNPARFITAFPNGNTGALLFFNPVEGGTVGVSLKSVESIHHAQDNQTGVTGELTLNGDATFGLALLGSVRTLRDHVEGDTLHDIFNASLGGYGDGEIWLTRQWLNGSTVQYLGFFAADNNTRLDPRPNDDPTQLPNVNVTRVDPSQNATLRFESTFNFTVTTPPTPYVPMRGLGMDELFGADNSSSAATVPATNGTEDTTDILAAIRGPGREVVDQVSFLAYESEFLAGGWRFLTYFGRDTLLAMQVLLPVLSPEACEAILAGVIQRTNATSGELCHEETVGDYASFLNIEAGHPELGNTPQYDYKMVDTDFLLLPALAMYAERYPDRVDAFLARNSTLVPGIFSELVRKNVDHVLNLTRAFAADPVGENLVPIRAGFPVGNWRDSNNGLGWGIYPFDVNCAMIPAALRALDSLQSLIPQSEGDAGASAAADVWEEKGCALFNIPISSADANARLNAYIPAANLSAELLYGAGSLNNTQTVSANSSAGWNDPAQIVGGANESTLIALSLQADFTPVDIQHSDLGFALLYSPTVPTAIIEAAIEALQPYPRGLLTNAGMVVANPAYSANESAPVVFSNTAYHGAVSWSWQQAYMAAGVERQLALCDATPDRPTPDASSNSTLSARWGGDSNSTDSDNSADSSIPAWCATHASALRQAQTRLWDAIAGSASVLWTEVWTPVFDATNGTFSVGDLGALSSDGSEGDAIQLWSYGFLALRDPRSGRPVAAGFA